MTNRNGPRYLRDGRFDYRTGVLGFETPRGRQPRIGGPPLLFLSDVKMTMLVTLALTGRPVRPTSLWKTIGVRSVQSLDDLVENGVVAKWSLSRTKTFVALDTAHPAAAELRDLLLVVARTYPGFSPVPYEPADGDGGEVPYRARRRRDVRYTFGSPANTMPLLIAHILGEASAQRVALAVPYIHVDTVRHGFHRLEAFGLCKRRRRAGGWPPYEWLASVNLDHPLGPSITAVLAAIDRAMPQWRIIVESQTGIRYEPHERKKRYHLNSRTRGLAGW